MARFAFSGVPEVAPTGAPGNDYERIQASPEMFGGLIAGAEQKLGSSMESASEHGMSYLQAKQGLTNEISASETNTWLAKNLTDKFNDFGRLEGKAAQDALPQFKQDTEDIYQQTIKNAGDNLQMKAMLAKSGRFLTDKYYLLGTQHADHQWRSWQSKTADDRATEYGNQAAVMAQHGTWDDVDIALNTSDDEVRKKLEAHKYDADSISAEVKKRRGVNVKNIVETLSASGDPRTAQAVFDKYKDGMDAGSVLAVTSHLKSLNAQLDGRQIADEETGRSPRGAAPAPIAGMPASFVGALKREEGFDPKPRWDVKQWTVGYGTKATSADERPDQAELEKRFQTAVAGAGKIVDGVNPKLDPGTRAALISLTHNTGDAWTRAGLGDRVRAGDIAGAQQKFLEYANVAGAPNAAIAERRWREAQWFGQAEAPSGGRAPDKAQVFDRILARTADNPLRQNAAIARMNQIYSVERAEHTQNQVLFTQRVKDTTAEAFQTGSTAHPLSENDFVQAHGFAQGRAQYADYKANLALGADVAAAANMSPEDRYALSQHYTPQAGSPGYAEALRRKEALDTELTNLDTERRKDPGGYAINRLPDAKAAYQGMAKVESDPKATDEQKKAARANFAAVTAREQARVGVEPMEQRLLSKRAAEELNGTFDGIADNPDPAARLSLIARVAHEANLWGEENWPQVMRQITPATQPLVRAIAAGADPIAMARLLRLDKKDTLATILNEETGAKTTDLHRELNTAMAPLKATMVGSQIDRDYRPYYNLGEKLTALHMRDGDDATTAATKSFNELIGSRSEFRDSWRMPKSAGVSADDVQAGTFMVRQQIREGAEVPATAAAPFGIVPFKDDLALGEHNRADSFRNFARDGRLVTAPGNDGLNLIDGRTNAPVRTADGKVLVLSWAQLAKLGGTPAARAAAIDAGLYSTGVAP